MYDEINYAIHHDLFVSDSRVADPPGKLLYATDSGVVYYWDWQDEGEALTLNIWKSDLSGDVVYHCQHHLDKAMEWGSLTSITIPSRNRNNLKRRSCKKALRIPDLGTIRLGDSIENMAFESAINGFEQFAAQKA